MKQPVASDYYFKVEKNLTWNDLCLKDCGSKEANSMLLHSSPFRELMSLGIGPSTVAVKSRDSDLLISRRNGVD